MPEQIGEKTEQVKVEQFFSTVDAEGQPIPTWVHYRTLWARAEYLSGRELEGMQKVNSAINVKFIVNYRRDIAEDPDFLKPERMRIVWRKTNWNIHAILPLDKFDMALACSRVQ